MPPVFILPNTTASVGAPLQTKSLAGLLTCAVGLTVIVKVLVGPSHVAPPLVKCGVTMIVATTGDVPALIAVNVGIFPLPVAANPMLISLLVQVYVVTPPVLIVAKVTVAVLLPLHTTWLAGWSTSPVGLTVIVNVFVGPSHVTPPLVKCGVTMIVAITGNVPALIAVNVGISPLPVAANPIDG